MITDKYKNITAVLVHAAWADASSWNKVAMELDNLGLNVRSAQIPLTSLTDDVSVVRQLLKRVDGPIVLVGHSYAGAVVTAAATDNSQVKALIFIAAIVPAEGETVGALFHDASRREVYGRNSLPIKMDSYGCPRARSREHSPLVRRRMNKN